MNKWFKLSLLSLVLMLVFSACTTNQSAEETSVDAVDETTVPTITSKPATATVEPSPTVVPPTPTKAPPTITPTAAPPYEALVSIPLIDLWTEASYSSSFLRTVPKNEIVEIIEESLDGTWWLVKTLDEKQAWAPAPRLNLREGPSNLHAIITQIPDGGVVSVVGRDQGGEWVLVNITSEDQTGWMAADFLSFFNDVNNLPIAPIQRSWMFNGKIMDTDENPVDLIEVFAIQNIDGNTVEMNATSNAAGEFYFYVPFDFNAEDASHSWTIEIQDISCDAAILNSNCDFQKYVLDKMSQVASSPYNDPIIFSFIPGEIQVTGTVVNVQNLPVGDISIKAISGEGTVFFTTSNDLGEFTLNLIPGNWEVYTYEGYFFPVASDPKIEGKHVKFTLEEGVEPEGINIPSP
ncbi:MAG: SH3 domain-containing protein [Anaerolineaceae bacterium]|nr:SH3 domain-containing protein [Anaerolineaceae bacterium]